MDNFVGLLGRATTVAIDHPSESCLILQGTAALTSRAEANATKGSLTLLHCGQDYWGTPRLCGPARQPLKINLKMVLSVNRQKCDFWLMFTVWYRYPLPPHLVES